MCIYVMYKYKYEHNECVFVNMLKVRVQTEVELVDCDYPTNHSPAKGRGDEILLVGIAGLGLFFRGGVLWVSSVFLHGRFEVSLQS